MFLGGSEKNQVILKVPNIFAVDVHLLYSIFAKLPCQQGPELEHEGRLTRPDCARKQDHI
jgi:hypothetical protein